MKKAVRSRIRTRLLELFLVTGSFGIALAVGEVATRLYVTSQLKAQSAQSLTPIFEVLDDSKMVYRLKPNATVLGYQINSLGFRSPEISKEKAEGIFRIISLGDSIAFGMGVKREDKILSRVLEDLLNQHSEKPRFEVLNAGVLGYNSVLQYHSLKEELIHYQPDLVILNFCLNDADPIELEFETQTLMSISNDFSDYKLSLRAIINQSYFLRLIKDKVWELSPAMRRSAINLRTGEEAWADAKSSVAQMYELLKSHDVPLLVVMFPYDVQLGGDYADAGPQKDLISFFEERRIAYIDLFLPYQRSKADSLFAVDGVHPNELGHRIAAEEIFRHSKIDISKI